MMTTMAASEIRNLKWEEIRQRLLGLRLRVLEAWRVWGPGTTREVAARSGIDLLTFRPRTTELYELGLVELDGRRNGEGVYRFVPEELARDRWQARERQLEML
jgi:hypothetical protein